MLNRNHNGSNPNRGPQNGANHGQHSGSNNGRSSKPAGDERDEQLADFVDRLLASSGVRSLQAVPETIDPSLDTQDPELAPLLHTAVQLRNTFSCGKDAPLPPDFQARIHIQLEAEWQRTAPALTVPRPSDPHSIPPSLPIGGRPSFQLGSPFARRVAVYAFTLLLIALIVFSPLDQVSLPGASGQTAEVIPVFAAILLAVLVGIALFFNRKS